MTVENEIPQVDFQKLLEAEVPQLRGKFGPRYSQEVACPFCGGTTRFRYRAASERYEIGRVFCSHCAPNGLTAVQFVMRQHNMGFAEAIAWLANRPVTQNAASRIVPREPDRPLVFKLAERMNVYRPDRWRAYFHGRGIIDELINTYLLGYNGERYAIPCTLIDPQTGERQVWGIQYRIRPEVEEKLKVRGERYEKYLSQKGGHNKRLFNADFVNRKLPYVLVVESPLDCILLRRFGYPACAAFQGNNKARAWEVAWNTYLKQAVSVLVIPDNDANGMGDLFAAQKVCDIPKSHIHRLPDGVNDVGKLIEPWLLRNEETVQRNLYMWLGRPPLSDL